VAFGKKLEEKRKANSLLTGRQAKPQVELHEPVPHPALPSLLSLAVLSQGTPAAPPRWDGAQLQDKSGSTSSAAVKPYSRRIKKRNISLAFETIFYLRTGD